VLFFALRWKGNLPLCCSYIAYSVVIFVSTSFLRRMINNDFDNHLFSASYDITYFNMALPFILFVIVAGANWNKWAVK